MRVWVGCVIVCVLDVYLYLPSCMINLCMLFVLDRERKALRQEANEEYHMNVIGNQTGNKRQRQAATSAY